MERIMELAILAITMLLLPLLSGYPLWGRRQGPVLSRLVSSLTGGWLLLMACFEVATVPVILLHGKLETAVTVFLILALICLVLLFVLRDRVMGPGNQDLVETPGRRGEEWAEESGRGEWPEEGEGEEAGRERFSLLHLALLAGILALLGFMAFQYAFRMHVDDDDARYVANAVEAYETGIMLRVNPCTGNELTYFAGEMGKEVVSPITMFYAAYARFAKIHPAIMMHSLWPLIWLLLHACLLFLIGEELFERRSQQLFFLLCCLLVEMFSGTSIYTGGTFLLIRIWQGKALVPALMIPALVLLLLWGRRLQDGQRAGGLRGEALPLIWYLTLFVTNLAGCLVSGMGILLTAIGSFCVCLTLSLRGRSGRTLLPGLLCMAPNLVASGLYLLIKRVIFT